MPPKRRKPPAQARWPERGILRARAPPWRGEAQRVQRARGRRTALSLVSLVLGVMVAPLSPRLWVKRASLHASLSTGRSRKLLVRRRTNKQACRPSGTVHAHGANRRQRASVGVRRASMASIARDPGQKALSSLEDGDLLLTAKHLAMEHRGPCSQVSTPASSLDNGRTESCLRLTLGRASLHRAVQCRANKGRRTADLAPHISDPSCFVTQPFSFCLSS